MAIAASSDDSTFFGLQHSNFEHTLQYTVHNWSSFSPNYHPNNVLDDKPHNQASRWSSDTNYPPQFICLKLSQPAIVTQITFGKFEKTHVCNLRKFSVYGGVTEDHMVELLTGGLKNDHKKETFTLKHHLENHMFPCVYIKIVPIMSWGPSFNFSIWHVSVAGISENDIVKPCVKWYSKYREQKALRLCLKHFRRKNYTDAFNALKEKANIQLEHPLLTDLHEILVRQGAFAQAEALIEKVHQDGYFNRHVDDQPYNAKWKTIVPLNENGMESSIHPGMRGGHQMCIDQEQQMIYLIGGWDGHKDLADFWVYSIKMNRWQCLSEDTSQDGGPSARSCHKICLDSTRRDMFVFGRYLDNEARLKEPLVSELFKYNLDSGEWSRLSDNTSAEAGPELIFDHQMVFDPTSDKMFVFGGRILGSQTDISPTTGLPTASTNSTAQDLVFSGLFTYHIPSNTWTKLRDDENSEPNKSPRLRSRIGHSMLFDEISRCIYIFAGQRGRENLNDFMSYSIEDDKMSEMISRGESTEVPSPGFTQRSTIDTSTSEIFVLSGLSKDKVKMEDGIQNSFWVYNLKTKKWSCIYKNQNQSQQYWLKMKSVEPCPRFAHQLVYDQKSRVHYLFGGNPGRSLSEEKLRLDDFWKLELQKESVEHLTRKCKYKIRKLRFKELAESDSIEALTYLQNDVCHLVDHGNIEERKEFESLASSLFASHQVSSEEDEEMSDSEGSVPSHIHKARSNLFDDLVNYFPREMTQPEGNLVDYIPLL